MVESYSLISTQRALDGLVSTMEGITEIALDTEFKRTNTYWPRLGLIQVAIGKVPFLIDPLKKDLSYEAFFKALQNPRLLKVLHAPYEDLEVLNPYVGGILSPIFDTQLASTFCGMGENTGYECLVATLMGQDIIKECQRSEWLHRPLSQKQCLYAAQDVTYLLPLFHDLQHRLEILGRHSWCAEEVQQQFSAGFLEEKKGRLPRRLGFKTSDPERKHHLTEIAREACMWRDQEAQSRNLPRKWIMSDQELICLVENRELDLIYLSQNPSLKRLNKLGQLSSYHKQFSQFKGIHGEPKVRLSEQDQDRLEKLRSLLNVVAQEIDLPPFLLAKPEDLISLLKMSSNSQTPRVLHGWRKKVFGDKAAALLDT